MTSFHVKNNLGRTRGEVHAKSAMKKKSKEFIKRSRLSINIYYEFHVKIAFQKKKKTDKNCWPIIGKEPFLRTGLSVIETIRMFWYDESMSDKLLFTVI